MIIRQATSEDCPGILAFWNPLIATSDVTFNSVEKTPDELAREIAQKAAKDQPFLLAVEADEILGFVTYAQFRGSNGYRFTLEHTIILAENSRSKGIGHRLMLASEDHARTRGHHSMIAGISHRNQAGIGFHLACGYQEIARLPEVGFKFDRWCDLILMQKML